MNFFPRATVTIHIHINNAKTPEVINIPAQQYSMFAINKPNLLLLETSISVIKVLLCQSIYSLTRKAFMKKSLPSQSIKNMDPYIRDLQVSI